MTRRPGDGSAAPAGGYVSGEAVGTPSTGSA